MGFGVRYHTQVDRVAKRIVSLFLLWRIANSLLIDPKFLFAKYRSYNIRNTAWMFSPVFGLYLLAWFIRVQFEQYSRGYLKSITEVLRQT